MDTMRIFVGGLGEGVTDDDLRRMFVALGSVDEIEIIRSKGRSMAYLNYTPSSAKSLAKLFSSVSSPSSSFSYLILYMLCEINIRSGPIGFASVCCNLLSVCMWTYCCFI